MNSDCNSSIDCTLLNGEGDSVARTCYITNEGNYCDCSNIIGWIGKYCDQITGFLIFLRIFSLLRLLFALFLSFYAGKLILLMYQVTNELKHQRKYSKVKRRTIVILIFLSVGIICAIASTCVYQICLWDNSSFEVIEFKKISQNSISASYMKPAILLDLLNVGFIVSVFSASLQISLSWIDLLTRYNMIVRDIKNINFITRYAHFVTIITTLISISCFTLMATRYVETALTLGAFSMFLLLLLFIIGHKNVGKLLSTTNKGKIQLETLNLFDASAKGNVIALSLVCASLGLYSIVPEVEAGRPRPRTIAVNLSYLFMLLVILVNLTYLKQVIQNLHAVSSQSGSKSYMDLSSKYNQPAQNSLASIN